MVSFRTSFKISAEAILESKQKTTAMKVNVRRRISPTPYAELLRILSRKLDAEARTENRDYVFASPSGDFFGLVMLGFRPAGQFRAAGYQPCSTFISHIRPGPLDEHNQAIAETNEKENVHEQPTQPGKISRNVQSSELRNCRRPADGGETALINIMKMFTRLIAKIPCNRFRDGTPFLYGHGRDSR